MWDLSVTVSKVSGCRQTTVAKSCCSRIYPQAVCAASAFKVTDMPYFTLYFKVTACI